MSLHRLRRDPSFCAYLILLSVQVWGILHVQIFVMKSTRGEHHCLPHCETRTAQREARATDRFVSKYGASVVYSSNFLHSIRGYPILGLDMRHRPRHTPSGRETYWRASPPFLGASI